MNYLLDTCVISEYSKKKLNQPVIKWLDDQQKDSLFISILTIAELKKGIFKIRKSQPERYTKLNKWIKILEKQFDGRILSLSQEILNTWAEITGESEANGNKLSIMDSLIGATALEYNLIIVTRNVSDFNFSLFKVFSPWEINRDNEMQ
ncbi:type II toxin-antitoxin system VapC family toxin [Cyanobacterium aponinum FACHB-4101]|uniref:type II toxin-antitoxin system VapC family toxin n=1 Tax=Cyanobacterium aponinum TaxID=379064 RepID=UPI00168169C0|nr:type II toxin-antitoxin system VapC family toxin [Cyanobacterium aponinum]MBD2394057.1 type II toxin-antitoxin system VapC family toxin [Cyanobacterium aponinum FACHB-4101]